MSILIQGMALPPKGTRLFVAVNWCGDVYVITSGSEIITKHQPSAKAIELPPHGDLVDRNKIRANFFDKFRGEDVAYVNMAHIDKLTPVIPAEGGADG